MLGIGTEPMSWAGVLAGISLLDGLLLAGLAGWPWLGCGVAGAALTWLAQRYVRGD